jgi:hypothetical protein
MKPRTLVRLEELGELKKSKTSLALEPVTFWFVALCVNQLRYRQPHPSVLPTKSLYALTHLARYMRCLYQSFPFVHSNSSSLGLQHTKIPIIPLSPVIIQSQIFSSVTYFETPSNLSIYNSYVTVHNMLFILWGTVRPPNKPIVGAPPLVDGWRLLFNTRPGLIYGLHLFITRSDGNCINSVTSGKKTEECPFSPVSVCLPNTASGNKLKWPQWPSGQSLATDPEVPGSIPGATKFAA